MTTLWVIGMSILFMGLVGVWCKVQALCRLVQALLLQRDSSPEQPMEILKEDPLLDVLHGALAGRTGKLRVSEALLICGIEPGKSSGEQIVRFGRAMRALGWERQRQPDKHGSFQYVYVKGSLAEREVPLVVSYDAHHMRSARIDVGTPV